LYDDAGFILFIELVNRMSELPVHRPLAFPRSSSFCHLQEELMKSAASSLQTSFSNRPTTFLATFPILLVLTLTTGCGYGGNSTQPPKLSGNTSVTVVLSSTANDQLAEFDLEFQSVTLTSQSGKTVSLLTAQQPSEFIHLIGGAPTTL
jgi:hypothetical protein